MAYAYYKIGKRIVLEEQSGAQRAAYGQQIIKELSGLLTARYGKGFSVSNLKSIRQFYLVYSTDRIGQTVFSQSERLPAVETGRNNAVVEMTLPEDTNRFLPSNMKRSYQIANRRSIHEAPIQAPEIPGGRSEGGR
jgi:hypothetical protein